MLTPASVRLLLAVALVAASLTTPFAQNQPASTADIPRVPFEKYTLPNGLEVILSQNRRLPMVAVSLWYHVGPANEESGRTGFAHLFEHMMFQSSKHVPADSHIRLLEAAGASDLNGTTDYDRTNYFETVPANQLELALWLESDRMGYLLEKVDQAALSNQQDVVRNERRQSVENQPYGLAEEALVQALFPNGHPYYGNVIGSHEDIQAVKLDDVNRFFRQYYAPNNASVAIVGDFDSAQTKMLVEKYFGTLRRGPAVPPVKADTPRITAERRRVVPSRVELPRVYMAWLTPSIFKPGDADADLTAGILGGGRSSRLYKKLVYEKQIAQNVSAQQYSLILGSIFQIEATARPGHTAEELERAIEEELAAVKAEPPVAREVEQARNTIETGIIGGLERLGGFGGIADRLNMYNHYLGTPDYLDKDIQRYRAVTPASVQAFAREHLATNARVVVHAVQGQPQTAASAPAPTATPAAPGGEGQSINADEPWRFEMPKPGPARPLQLATPASATLPNGLTLILNERRGLPVVAANLVIKTGSDANPVDKAGLANFVAAMLDEGTATRGAPQIADETAHLGATLNTGSTMDATTVSARSLSKNFDATLTLMADVALRPSFPADEIERQRASRLGQLVQQRDNPGQVAGEVMAVALYGPRHPYGYTEIGTESSMKAVMRDEMAAFWKQHFVPNNAALVVAGDISMTELRALAEESFGSWQRGTPARPTLPPVVCVIVHHGESGWTTPRRLHELIEGLDIAPELRRFVPEFELVIDDLASQSDEVLEARPLPTFPKLALWLLRDGRNVEALLAHLSHWARQLERLDPAGEDFLVVMRYILWVAGDRPFEEIRKRVVTVVPAAEIPMASAAEQLIQEGVRRGEAKGRAEGEAQGKAEAVLDVLDARGLVVTAEQRARILACTDVAQLASWLRVAATAGSASELFAH